VGRLDAIELSHSTLLYMQDKNEISVEMTVDSGRNAKYLLEFVGRSSRRSSGGL